MDMINEAGKGEKTKYRLARSMKECMKTMSVDNITVKQITENCGVTRQTFYWAFHFGKTIHIFVVAWYIFDVGTCTTN